MAAPIGPGDFVECVDASAGRRNGARWLRAGALYCVAGVDSDRACGTGRCGRLCNGLFLREDPDGSIPWCGSRFRPIYRPSADLIADLSRPVDPARADDLVEA